MIFQRSINSMRHSHWLANIAWTTGQKKEKKKRRQVGGWGVVVGGVVKGTTRKKWEFTALNVHRQHPPVFLLKLCWRQGMAFWGEEGKMLELGCLSKQKRREFEHLSRNINVVKFLILRGELRRNLYNTGTVEFGWKFWGYYLNGSMRSVQFNEKFGYQLSSWPRDEKEDVKNLMKLADRKTFRMHTDF
jgi:hypothetical protein